EQLQGCALRRVEPPPDAARGYAGHDRVGLHVVGHDGASADDGTVTNGDARHDEALPPEPNVVADHDRALAVGNAVLEEARELELETERILRRPVRAVFAADEDPGRPFDRAPLPDLDRPFVADERDDLGRRRVGAEL